MTQYTAIELEAILENDFLLNPKAFSPGRTNDDMVDSMLICYVLDREWTELFAKWVDNYTEPHGAYDYINHWKGLRFPSSSGQPIIGSDSCPEKEIEIERIIGHYNRVKDWLETRDMCDLQFIKNNINYVMKFSINYH